MRFHFDRPQHHTLCLVVCLVLSVMEPNADEPTARIFLYLTACTTGSSISDRRTKQTTKQGLSCRHGCKAALPPVRHRSETSNLCINIDVLYPLMPPHKLVTHGDVLRMTRSSFRLRHETANIFLQICRLNVICRRQEQQDSGS